MAAAAADIVALGAQELARNRDRARDRDIDRNACHIPLPPQYGTTLHSRYRHRWWRVAHSSVATVNAGDGRDDNQIKSTTGCW